MQFILAIPALLFAVTIHEFSHGFVAYKRGDPTAKMMGRLTLNPIAHLDPIGSILVPLGLVLMRSPFVFGWAKPVPVNFYNLHNLRKDMIAVSAAGIVSNLIVAVISAVLLKLVFLTSIQFSIIEPVVIMLNFSIAINCVLAVFNLIPVPPLDGSKILMGLLPPKQSLFFARMEPYGMFIVLILFMTGIINVVITPPLYFLIKILGGQI